MARDPSMVLTLERQFCSICRGTGRGWVRVANLADMVELRKQYHPESRAVKVYRARRRAAAIRHLRQEHPEIAATFGA